MKFERNKLYLWHTNNNPYSINPSFIMKKIILLSIVALLSTFSYAQDFSLKYGKITDYELNMKTYTPDTAAAAVILYMDGYTYYDFIGDRFKVITEVSRKIKVLKQEGAEYASITIPYFYQSGMFKDDISGLDAVVYNVENGKTVKSKLEKKYIFEEKINDNFYRMKVSIPNAKVGSVIEYKYRISSDRYYDIPNQQMQFEIPVVTSKYEVRIPEYFIYNIETKGYERMDVSERAGSQTFTINTRGEIQSVSCSTREITYKMNQVPALKDEAYVWNIRDFRSAIIFELNGTRFPMSMYKSYATTWNDIEKNLKDNTDFLSNMNKSNPYKDDLKTLLASNTTDQEKIETIFTYVKNKVKWNDEYAFFKNAPGEAIKKGAGNNAQINSILMRALKDAGFNAYPVLMSQRSSGRLSFVHPSLDGLSTYIVGIDATDNSDTKYFLDGSSNYGGVNVLPVDLLVDRAYSMSPKATEKWVDLTRLNKNREVYIIKGVLNNDGKMTASADRILTNSEAYYFRKDYSQKKDSATYIQNLETKHDIKLDSMKLQGLNPLENSLTQHLVFAKEYDIAGEFLYINPLIFPHLTENRFTSSDRKLPVEFAYPYTYQYTGRIKIPDNYTVVELPKPTKMILNEEQAKCLYKVDQANGEILISYKFDLNQIIFPNTEYPAIRDFWGQMATKNTEMIVLKKK